MIYCSLQVPGKVRLAMMSAWVPYFMEASMQVPAKERVGFARQYRASAGSR
jgi:hypothetical protein